MLTFVNRLRSCQSMAFILFIILWGYSHIVLEFFFQITKISLFNQLSLFESVTTILHSLTTAMPYLLLFALLSFLLSFMKMAPYLILTFCLSLTGFVILENFTYTFFSFNLDNTVGNERFIYIPIFLFIWFLLYKFFYSFLVLWREATTHQQKKVVFISTFFIILFPIFSLLFFPGLSPREKPIPISFKGPLRTPSILFIGMDGVNADYLSMYGYYKNLTPHLDKFFEHSLLAENAFSNCGNTYGSVLSLLTGKSPVDTRVSLSQVSYLNGENQYLHFLAMLRQFGYSGIQLIVKSESTYNAQLKNGFTVINDQVVNKNRDYLWWLNDDMTKLFLNEVVEKITDRLDRLYGDENNSQMVLAEGEFKRNEVEKFADSSILRAKDFIGQNKDRPFFLNIHLMTTHGKVASPHHLNYAKGLDPIEENWEPYYLDALTESDSQLGEILDLLKEYDLVNKSIVVFYSDHGRKWTVESRVPLMIHFPHHEFSQKVATNVQIIDVVPTLLDYMGIKQPEWLKGLSLLDAKNILPQRQIYSVTGQEQLSDYYFKYGLVECQNFFRYSKMRGKEYRTVANHTAPCKDYFSTSFDFEDKQKQLYSYFQYRGHVLYEIPFSGNRASMQKLIFNHKLRRKLVASRKREKERSELAKAVEKYRLKLQFGDPKKEKLERIALKEMANQKRLKKEQEKARELKLAAQKHREKARELKLATQKHREKALLKLKKKKEKEGKILADKVD